MGMAIEAVAPGSARMAMTVAPHMVNGHGLCHGGYIFCLADSAMAFASNSHNEKMVAQHCGITFLRPARLGMRLVASAQERTRAGRSGIYDVTVTAEDAVIVEFRGATRSIGEKLLEE